MLLFFITEFLFKSKQYIFFFSLPLLFLLPILPAVHELREIGNLVHLCFFPQVESEKQCLGKPCQFKAKECVQLSPSLTVRQQEIKQQITRPLPRGPGTQLVFQAKSLQLANSVFIGHFFFHYFYIKLNRISPSLDSKISISPFDASLPHIHRSAIKYF